MSVKAKSSFNLSWINTSFSLVINIASTVPNFLINIVPSLTPKTNNAVDNASPSIDLSEITLIPVIPDFEG